LHPSSSIAPSQSLSMPSQVSTVGEPGVQVPSTPAVQVADVCWHAPIPQERLPSPSSSAASQSSSSPLQLSVNGVLSLVQGLHAPFSQCCVPAWQVPTPRVPAGPV
jgi:hypothetical protein